MKPFRASEEPSQLDAVIETANKMNAMVVVVSGGERNKTGQR
jgi:hypothetical protein